MLYSDDALQGGLFSTTTPGLAVAGERPPALSLGRAQQQHACSPAVCLCKSECVVQPWEMREKKSRLRGHLWQSGLSQMETSLRALGPCPLGGRALLCILGAPSSPPPGDLHDSCLPPCSLPQ